jgi:transcription elongation factor Elf1
METGCSMGRRRKKVVRIPKKRLPKFFSCPRCGKETVRVEIFREEGRAVAGCSSCGLQEEFQVKPAQGEVDVYCMLTDSVYGSSRGSSVKSTENA